MTNLENMSKQELIEALYREREKIRKEHHQIIAEHCLDNPDADLAHSEDQLARPRDTCNPMEW